MNSLSIHDSTKSQQNGCNLPLGKLSHDTEYSHSDRSIPHMDSEQTVQLSHLELFPHNSYNFYTQDNIFPVWGCYRSQGDRVRGHRSPSHLDIHTCYSHLKHQRMSGHFWSVYSEIHNEIFFNYLGIFIVSVDDYRKIWRTRTDRSEHTVQTQIRLLLQEQSELTLFTTPSALFRSITAW